MSESASRKTAKRNGVKKQPCIHPFDDMRQVGNNLTCMACQTTWTKVLPGFHVLTEHDVGFKIGQIVYLKMDNDQHARMVIGISLRPSRSVTYCLAFGSTESWHYEIEISEERDIVKATSN